MSEQSAPEVIEKPFLYIAAVEPNADPLILRHVRQWQNIAAIESFLLLYFTD